MKKLLIFLALCAIPSTVFSDEPDKKLHNQCLYPSILVNHKFAALAGTGTIVRSEKVGDEYHNVVISCAHIFGHPDMKNYVAKMGKYEDWSTRTGYETYDLIVYQVDKTHDLSVSLFKSKTKMPTAEFDFKAKLYIGSEVFRFGCGVGDELRLDFGKITALNTKLGSIKNVTRMNIYTVPGDSGSAVFHKYKIIAITQAIRTYRNLPCFGISYAIPISRIKTWNTELNNVISFSYEADKQVPIIPFVMRKFDSYEQEKRIVPPTIWEKQ